MRTRRIETHELRIDLAPKVGEQLERLQRDAAAFAQVGDREQDADSYPSSEVSARNHSDVWRCAWDLDELDPRVEVV